MLKNENRIKRGRPPKEDKRSIVFRIRLNTEEDQMLTEISKQMGLTKCAVIRKGILAYYKKENEHAEN